MAPPVCVLHHHIGAESPFERGLGTTTHPAAFERQLNWLLLNYDVIDLDTLLSGRLPRRPLLLTFDDAFRSVLEVARNVLAPRRVPAIYFINPGLIGQDALSLDAAVAWAAATVGLERLCQALGIPKRARISEVLGQDMARLGARQRADAKQRILDAFGPADLGSRAEPLHQDDIKSLPGLGVEVGNHTMTHVHCRSLDAAEIETEIVAAKARLEALSGRRVRAFSVPYGDERDLPPAVLSALRAHGHEAIFLVHARSNLRRPAPDIWYRTSLRNEEPGELRRMLHYLPLARTARKLLLG